jgi:predicted dehydrogenase
VLRLAIIGCGRVVERHHLPALAAVAEVAVSCLVETSGERRAAAAKKCRGAAPCAELDQALSLDLAHAALIATPPASHADLARRCLAAGLHVLVEKPLAVSAAEARDVVRAAARADRRLAVGFNRRFRPSWRAARRLLAAAGGTAVEDARLTLVFDTRPWGTATALADEHGAMVNLLADVAPHQLDLLAFLFGNPVKRVRSERLRFVPTNRWNWTAKWKCAAASWSDAPSATCRTTRRSSQP